MALSAWLSSLAALQLARSGSLHWRHAPAEAIALQEALARADPEALAHALGAEAARRIGRLLDGIEGYRAHPYRRRLADPPVLWQAGTTRVLAFGGEPAGTPVLLVPSLINRAYILDLTARRSFARYLKERGLRPYLLDWGAPGAEERAFGLDDYILGRLVPALEAARQGRRPAGRARRLLHGRHDGAAARRPRRRRLAGPAGDPLGFSGRRRCPGTPRRAAWPALSGLIEGLGELPADALQAMFAALDPLLAARKFTAFAQLPPASAAARNFVALEDWLNDAVPLAGPVARACLQDWYGANAPARGHWRVGGEAVRPERVAVPALNVVPARDRIVPPASAASLSAALPRVETWRPPLGHIGMMASPRTKRLLWRRLADWIAAHTATTSDTGRHLKTRPCRRI